MPILRKSLPFILAGLLILYFLNCVFVPAHEYPMRPEQVMTMVLEAAMIAGLIGLRKELPLWLFIVALLCGAGLFLIRFDSDAAWWTGHIRYSLLPR